MAIRTLVVLTLMCAASACGGSLTAGSHGPAPAPRGVAEALVVPRATGSGGESGTRIVGVGFDPARAVIELSHPAYVTLIAVTAAKIEAIIPAAGVQQQVVGAGLHIVSLSQLDSARFGVADRFGSRVGVLEDNVSAAVVIEYNRCLYNARLINAQRSQERRAVIGRDSAGRPIYGPATAPSDPREDAERYCRMPERRSGSAVGGGQQGAKGRYLLLFASDSPTEHRDVLALAISEGDPQSITAVIGRRLFGARGVPWSGSFMPW